MSVHMYIYICTNVINVCIHVYVYIVMYLNNYICINTFTQVTVFEC